MKLEARIDPALALILTCLFAASCTTTGSDELATTANYVYPRVKYTATADYSLTKAERKVALRELRQRGAEVLYEVVAAQDGSITRIRPIKSLPGDDGDYFTLGFMHQLQARKLKPSHMRAPYRTFFFALNVNHTTEFLGSQGFID